MGRGVDRKKLAEWQRRLSRCERTGLKAVEFCKRERVSVALLKYWQRQVEFAALRSSGPAKRAAQAAVFAPVEVRAIAPCWAVCHDWAIALVVPAR